MLFQKYKILVNSYNNLNKKLQGFYRQKDQKFDHFFDELMTEYKLFKKMTHECQMNCFGNTDFNRKQSDACARSCLDPYLYIRKSIGDKIGQCDHQFQQQESKCMSSTDMDCNTGKNLNLFNVEFIKNSLPKFQFKKLSNIFKQLMLFQFNKLIRSLPLIKYLICQRLIQKCVVTFYKKMKNIINAYYQFK